MKITTDQFDSKLIEILDGMTGAQLLNIPGVYEVVSEELNNNVIEAIEADCEPYIDDEPHVFCSYCGNEIPPDCSECGCQG